MLKSLRVSNYALIDHIDIDFCDGLNIITGETGAGKSIIMGALALILGARADQRHVTDPNRKTIVEAIFTPFNNQRLKESLTAHDLDWDQEQCILRREISTSNSSRSRAFVNDTPVTLSTLRDVALQLIDIHSQHQNQLLGDPEYQRQILDTIAGNQSLLEDYASTYNQLRHAMSAFKKLKATATNDANNAEFMRYQLERLEQLHLQPGEYNDLLAQRAETSASTEAKHHTTAALQSLTQDESSVSALLDLAATHLRHITEAESLTARLMNLQNELTDISRSLAHIDSSIDANPADLEALDQRISQIESALSRYKVSSDVELIEIRDNLRSRLDRLDQAPGLLAQAHYEAKKLHQNATRLAERITRSRNEAAKKLAQQITQVAAPLGMTNIVCSLDIDTAPLGQNGADNVNWRFAFNKNQTPQPVSLTASGGEISRLMLSLKSVIAAHMTMPTMILDEIDTGVSGDVAARMGAMMARMGASHQLLTITHLPQVAARGSVHYKVYKADTETSTHTYIRKLNHNERIAEIAMMLSGSDTDTNALATAQTLIESKPS